MNPSLARGTGASHRMIEKTSETIFKAMEGDRFKFRCHKDIPCFTRCCAALNLVLTPYDILRMKNFLGLSSGDFLDQYTETKMDGQSRFPMVYLKMNRDARKTCPFLTPEGCRLYKDRPGACRIYPLGRAALKVSAETRAREKYFIVQEAHCLGFKEDKEWTVAAWLQNEGLDEYTAMNDEWLEIITSRKGLGSEAEIPRKMQMFFMASYNLDKFRSFIFNSPFFRLFEVAPDLEKNLAGNDEALMRFSFRWLKFSLFGEPALKIRENR